MSEAQEQRIEKTVEINAPIDRVWKLMTDPSELPRWWFSMESAELDLTPGGAMLLKWKKDEHGVSAGRVLEVREPAYFAWNWATRNDGTPPAPGEQTLVEFRLEEVGDVTRVTVNESGFEALTTPPEERMITLEGNTEGWTQVLDHLREVFA